MSATLSRQETRVVRFMAKGETYQGIAARMGIGFETVKSYAANVRRKLDAKSKVDVIRWAFENELLDN